MLRKYNSKRYQSASHHKYVASNRSAVCNPHYYHRLFLNLCINATTIYQIEYSMSNNETVLRIGSDGARLWFEKEPIYRQILGICISRHAGSFLRSFIYTYGRSVQCSGCLLGTTVFPLNLIGFHNIVTIGIPIKTTETTIIPVMAIKISDSKAQL